MKIGISKGKAHQSSVLNKAGGISYKVKDPAASLMHSIGHFINEPKYYPDPVDTESVHSDLDSEALNVISSVVSILESDHPEDALAIARWARDPISGGKLRTTPLVVLATVLEDPLGVSSGKGRRFGPLARRYASSILVRPDEPRLLFAAWRSLFANAGEEHRTYSPPKMLGTIIKERLSGISEEMLLKYKGTGSPSLSDVLRMDECRTLLKDPKFMYFVNKDKWLPNSNKTPVYKAREKLANYDGSFGQRAIKLAEEGKVTWEVLVSKFGGTKEVWTYLVPKLGYMALLRNLRNILEANVSKDVIELIASRISDREEVLKSGQLPFRYISALSAVGYKLPARSYRQFDEESIVPDDEIINALSEALDISAENLPDLPGKTAFFVDNSGSMDAPLSERSRISAVQAGNILAAMMAKKCPGRVIACAFTDKPYRVQILKNDSVLNIFEKICKAGGDGGSTNAHLCPPWLIQKKAVVDRIILISDMQCYDSYHGGNSFQKSFAEYRRTQNTGTWLHSVNIMGTEQAQVKEGKNVCLLSGFSENLLKIIVASEGLGKKSNTPAVEAIRQDWYLK